MTKPRTQVLAVVAASTDSHTALESLDAIFASAVFDIAVSVLFMGETIATHLLATTGANTSGKNIAKQWQASELYDIKALWVLSSDLNEHNINAQQLPSHVTILTKTPDTSVFKHVLSL